MLMRLADARAGNPASGDQEFVRRFIVDVDPEIAANIQERCENFPAIIGGKWSEKTMMARHDHLEFNLLLGKADRRGAGFALKDGDIPGAAECRVDLEVQIYLSAGT